METKSGLKIEEGVSAFQETPTGALIQLRGFETDDGTWTEVVEIVDEHSDGSRHVTTLYEGHGLLVAQVYNRVIDVFVEIEAQEGR